MAVDVHGRPHLRVPEQLHDDPRMDSFGQQQGGRGVAAVVQPNVADAGPFEQPAPVVIVALLVDRPAVGLGEDEVVVVLPVRSGQHPLAHLGRLVHVQCGHQRQREGQGALAPLGLGCLVDQAAALDPVDGASYGQRVVEQVDVAPLQRERFGLA
jgi:hypothetical protein